MINKNDCFDCDHSIKSFDKWVCEITGKPIPNEGIQENDCDNFKYPE